MRHPHHASRLKKAQSRAFAMCSYGTHARIAAGHRVALVVPYKPYRPQIVVFRGGKCVEVKRAARLAR